jgi:hypothetical protein
MNRPDTIDLAVSAPCCAAPAIVRFLVKEGRAAWNAEGCACR